MEMIDVLKRLQQLDAENPRVETVVKEEQTLAVIAETPEMINESKDQVVLNLPEPDLGDLKALSGVKTLTESAIVECGMAPMGAPMPNIPASINMSAQSASEIVAMMRGIMDLAGTDVPSQTMMPAMGAPMPALPSTEVKPEEPKVTGPTFDNPPDDKGDDELSSMLKKIKTGEPVTIKTDMPVKVKSDEKIKTTADSMNQEGSQEQRMWDTSPDEKVRDYNPNDFAHIVNTVRDFDYTPPNSGSNPMPQADKKKESANEGVDILTSKLFDEYQKFISEVK